MPTQNIALELTKALLSNGSPITIQEAKGDPSDSMTKAILQKARLDAAYAARLYQTIIERLEK